MRFGWIVPILLSFPVLEAIGIFWMADAIGGWVLLWLLLDVVAGIALIRVERIAWGARLMFSLQSGTHPLASLLASGRILLAGGLLVFPGFISDLMAVALLLTPGTWAGRRRDPLRPANDEAPSPQPPWGEYPEGYKHAEGHKGANTTPKTIDGEFRRESDDPSR
ncbi:MAG: FxsA family protein [Thiobacillus sp.]|jgi:UPF0716 protein FxsA|uniref:FxsA family protein n=1 Tax=Thiobacillus sp. TaxID=924 RepID=UPI00289471B3|nr:FxsA family protein [Thiobacillus sp.]MDT3705845.1 FxsA family protein [Thiobacillus sp.]